MINPRVLTEKNKCPACGEPMNYSEDVWCNNSNCGYGPFGNYIWPDGYPHLHSWDFQKKRILNDRL